ncbi:MAG TPA: alpha/beta fold hydrolase [Longimicrobiales bacterium]|nr:alpha/beta fold hydrolase [Longimicrobiales bacterium]
MEWRENGSGEAVLLVHGFPFSAELWDDQLRDVPGGWRFIAPDLPGFGASRLDVAGPLTMDLLAQRLVMLIEELGLRRAVVCGLSMGGYVALAMWRRHPARVRALVLANTRATADTPAARAGRLEDADRVRREGTGALVEAMIPRLLSEAARRQKPELVERLRAIMRTASPEGVAAALEGMAQRPDSTPLLHTIEVPALVVAGSEDGIVPFADAQRLADGMPSASLCVIPGVGHVSNVEAPEEFNRELHAFLRGLSPRG